MAQRGPEGLCTEALSTLDLEKNCTNAHFGEVHDFWVDPQRSCFQFLLRVALIVTVILDYAHWCCSFPKISSGSSPGGSCNFHSPLRSLSVVGFPKSLKGGPYL